MMLAIGLMIQLLYYGDHYLPLQLHQLNYFLCLSTANAKSFGSLLMISAAELSSSDSNLRERRNCLYSYYFLFYAWP